MGIQTVVFGARAARTFGSRKNTIGDRSKGLGERSYSGEPRPSRILWRCADGLDLLNPTSHCKPTPSPRRGISAKRSPQEMDDENSRAHRRRTHVRQSPWRAENCRSMIGWSPKAPSLKSQVSAGRTALAAVGPPAPTRSPAGWRGRMEPPIREVGQTTTSTTCSAINGN